MAVAFKFDMEKTIAAVAFLAKQGDGNLSMFLSIKMLYLADKEALAKWGKPITGDTFVSMPKGPVLSRIYNLFKGIGTADHLNEWNSHFGETVNNSIRLLTPANVDVLSEGEMETLDWARKQVDSYAPWDVAEWLHRTCPEWEDPHGGSRWIDPAVILRNAGRTEDEIRMIEKSTEEFNQLEEVFNNL